MELLPQIIFLTFFFFDIGFINRAAYQSTVSQIKSALGDFLTAVDVLLLKERCDDVQKELYFEKVLDTLKSTREALAVSHIIYEL